MRVQKNGRNEELQLDLFGSRLPANGTFDAIRLPGRETLEGVPAENGRGTGEEREVARDASGSRGTNGHGNGRVAPPFPEPRSDGGAGTATGLGIGPREIPLPAARVLADNHGPSETDESESQPLLNQNNYRIKEADRIGAGSLKQKCRDNLDAIAVLKQIEKEERSASTEERRALVRYVGWGGLPHVVDASNE